MSAPLLTHRVDGIDRAEAGTVLLLNGGFMSIASWQPIAARLAERYRVVRCDFRGQLLTPGPAHRELAANVDDVVALLDHLGLAGAPRGGGASGGDGGSQPVHVLGTSFGGEVALLLAARHPERVASVIAVTVSDRATAAVRRGAGELRAAVAGLLAGGDRGAFHDALVGDVYAAAYVAANGDLLAERRRQIAELPDAWFEALDDLLAAAESFDVRGELGRIRCPALVVIAGDDRVLPPESGRAVARGIAGAWIAEHPASGHGLVLEDPDWLVDETLAFLAETS